MKQYLTAYKPAIQFMAFCALLSMGFLLAGTFMDAIYLKSTGLALDDIHKLSEISPELARKVRNLNAIMLIMILGLPAVLFAYLSYPDAMGYVGLKKMKVYWPLILGSVLMVVALPFAVLLESWSQYLPGINKMAIDDAKYERLATAMLQGPTGWDLWMGVLFIALIPAFVEELFFRGCLQTLFLRWLKKHTWLALIVVAVLFSAFHGQYSGFLPRTFLGILLGLGFFYSGRLWVSILMHALNNFITVLAYWLYHAGYISVNPEEWMQPSVIFGICSLLLVLMLLYFWHTRKETFVLQEVEPAGTNYY